MKYLYFLRHGIAVLKGTPGYTDDERPLTEEGIDKMQKSTKGIKRLVENFDIILTSPLRRAHDTAIIAAKCMECENKVEVVKILEPGCKPKEFVGLISKYSDKEHILVVGHEPDFSTIISELIGAQRTVVSIKKGALCRVDLDSIPPKEPGKVAWLLQPKILRTAGKK